MCIRDSAGTVSEHSSQDPQNIIQKSDEEVMSVLTRYEPFNDEIIADKIRRIVINENA